MNEVAKLVVYLNIDAIFELNLFNFLMFKNHSHHIYLVGILLLVASLPLSMFLLSLAQIILLLNWILENNFKEKWNILKSRRSIYGFLVFYLIHILGMIYSSDLVFGFHDLKIKLPLLVLPIIIGTSTPLNYKRFTGVLLVFCGAVFISTIISTGKLLGIWGAPVLDIRDISIFVSHIRLALMVNLAIFILIWLAFKSPSNSQKAGIILSIVWFIFFLVILKSLTGIVIFLIIIAALGLWLVFKLSNILVKWFLVVGLAMCFLLIGSYVSKSVVRFYKVEKVDLNTLENVTKNGNIYFHFPTNKAFENGNYTWLYVCEPELEKGWNSRSKLLYKGPDLKGQELRLTLIRYLTSKGLRKDSAGIASLTETDIHNIENGMANYIYSQKFSFYPRIYQVLWEIYQYQNGGNPSGNSFTQRFEYLKTASHIIKNNFWLGVGTGDVAKAFDDQYVTDKSNLTLRWRLRAHNQFITFFLTFGLVGFVIICTALIYPVYKEKMGKNYFGAIFTIIAFLSFLNEDTLETHAGLSFIAFFVSFFLYNKLNEKPRSANTNSKS
jgi:hypothetical protein